MLGRMSKKNAIAGLAAAGVLGVGIAVPAIAFAEGPSTNASPSATASPQSETEKQSWEQRREEHRDAFAEALAAELGVEKEKVAAALEKVREQMRAEAGTRHEGRGRPDGVRPDGARPDGARPDAEERAAERQARLAERLDQAVADGKLTREQADAIRKAIESGVLRGPGWGGGHGPR